LETATDINNLGYEVERKAINSDFLTIGFKSGFGISTKPQSFSFSDENVNSGIYSYCLKQIDYNGIFEYSDETSIEVLLVNKYFLVQNFPNSFNPPTKINYSLGKDEFVTLNIYDL